VKLEGSLVSGYRKTGQKSKTKRAFTTSQRVSGTERNESALTDHGTQENPMINWSVIDRSQIDLRDGLKKPCTSAKKDNKP